MLLQQSESSAGVSTSAAKGGGGDAGPPPKKKGGAPAVMRAEPRRLEQHDREPGAHGRAHPERAVDGEVDRTAQACRNQLVDRRIYRRVLPADAKAGEEATERERPD